MPPLERRKKRYICSFVKKNEDGEFKPDVIVIPAHNELLALVALVEKHKIPSKKVKRLSDGNYHEEGIKTIRLSETNTFEGGSSHDNFSDDS